jgi:hypothetical protein
MLAVGCLCGAPHAAPAQVTLGVGGGATFPVSDLNNFDKTGFNVLATLGFRIPSFPLGLRVDGMFNQLPSRMSGSSNSQIWTVNANLVANLVNVPHAVAVPYLIAGVGYYNTRYRVTTSGGTIETTGNIHNNDVGINGGVGLRIGLGSASLFAEGRYHYIFVSGTHLQMIPLTVGIHFGG